MGRETDQHDGQDGAGTRLPWTKPEIRRIELTPDEIAALRQADDPMALFLKMKRGGRAGK